MAEQKVAEAFQTDLEILNDNDDDDDDTKPAPRSRRSPVGKSAATLDLSWKDGGSTYPKASSRVGPRYQTPSIPIAGSFLPEDAKQDPDLQ